MSLPSNEPKTCGECGKKFYRSNRTPSDLVGGRIAYFHAYCWGKRTAAKLARKRT